MDLHAGDNSVVLFAVSDHGVSRVDTLAVSAASGSSPAAPTDLLAQPGKGGVRLSWTGSAGATSYDFFYNLAAINAAGTSPSSNEMSVKTSS